MTETIAGDFADPGELAVVCCREEMTVLHAEHVREGEGERNRRTDRIVRGCRECGAMVVTSLMVPLPEDVTMVGI